MISTSSNISIITDITHSFPHAVLPVCPSPHLSNNSWRSRDTNKLKSGKKPEKKQQKTPDTLNFKRLKPGLVLTVLNWHSLYWWRSSLSRSLCSTERLKAGKRATLQVIFWRHFRAWVWCCLGGPQSIFMLRVFPTETSEVFPSSTVEDSASCRYALSGLRLKCVWLIIAARRPGWFRHLVLCAFVTPPCLTGTRRTKFTTRQHLVFVILSELPCCFFARNVQKVTQLTVSI